MSLNRRERRQLAQKIAAVAVANMARKPGQQAAGLDEFDREALKDSKAIMVAGKHRKAGRALVQVVRERFAA